MCYCNKYKINRKYVENSVFLFYTNCKSGSGGTIYDITAKF